MLLLGDTQYEDGTLAQFQNSYALSWGRPEIKSITRPAIGNHEYQNGSNGVGYFDYFNGVGVATGPAGDRDKGYYSFNVTDGASVNWHVIALNSMCLRVGGCGAGSAQEQWLRADLAANSGAACTIAYWHHPLFNSGPDGNYNDDPQNNTIALWQALFEAGADVVLSGHAHIYQRYGPQDAAAVANAFGLREFVVGTGGKSLSTFGPTQPNLATRDNTKFGVLKLVLKASGYDWTFVSETGATSDPGSASCHGAPADTTQPETSISSGPNGPTPSRDAGFAFASSEAPASFRCRFDGPGGAIGTDAPCPSPRSFTGLADGAYTFTAYARDADRQRRRDARDAHLHGRWNRPGHVDHGRPERDDHHNERNLHYRPRPRAARRSSADSTAPHSRAAARPPTYTASPRARTRSRRARPMQPETPTRRRRRARSPSTCLSRPTPATNEPAPNAASSRSREPTLPGPHGGLGTLLNATPRAVRAHAITSGHAYRRKGRPSGG